MALWENDDEKFIWLSVYSLVHPTRGREAAEESADFAVGDFREIRSQAGPSIEDEAVACALRDEFDRIVRELQKLLEEMGHFKEELRAGV